MFALSIKKIQNGTIRCMNTFYRKCRSYWNNIDNSKISKTCHEYVNQRQNDILSRVRVLVGIYVYK